ncbi:hypothetical protein DFJ74DRAFT_696185 [Hyaloraphidium curvatum]|nr:hypothetical protein DFJ74DRAFT_696185 [Hyaloraphidium curvatum]
MRISCTYSELLTLAAALSLIVFGGHLFISNLLLIFGSLRDTESLVAASAPNARPLPASLGRLEVPKPLATSGLPRPKRRKKPTRRNRTEDASQYLGTGEPGIGLPWRLDAARYLSALTELELQRRNGSHKTPRFPEYSDPTSLPPFERCSAWAGWAFVNAWRENWFDLCDGGGSLDGSRAVQADAGTAPVLNTKGAAQGPARGRRRVSFPISEGRGAGPDRRSFQTHPSTDQLWKAYLEERRAHGPSSNERPRGPLFEDTAWKGRDGVFFTRPVATAASPPSPAIRCFQRSDVDPDHHLTLCASFPETPLLLPQGSYPITRCYLLNKDGKGCNFGWGQPGTTGVFPKGSVVAPGCSVSADAAARFRHVAGVSRKLGLALAPNVPDETDPRLGSTDVDDQQEAGYRGAGSVASLDGASAEYPPLNESARHGEWSLSWKAIHPAPKEGSPDNRRQTTLGVFDFVPEPVSECVHLVTEPVWFVERLDPINIYHGSEDHTHVFDALLVLPDDLLASFGNRSFRFVFLDPQEDGFFLEFWQRVSYPNPVRFLHKEPYPPGTCFVGGTVWSVHSERSVLSLGLHGEGWRGYGRKCPSLLLQAFNRWIRDLFADRTHTPASEMVWSRFSFRGDGRIVIPDETLFSFWDEAERLQDQPQREAWWMERESRSIVKGNRGRILLRRRHSLIWLSRRSLETTQAQLTSWQQARLIPAEVEECFLQRLLRFVLFRNSQQCIRRFPPNRQARECRGVANHFWDVENLEASDLSYAEQMERVGRADIIVGAHGAALTHAIHMRPGSAVVELAMGGNPHYEFMTTGAGHRYFATSLETQSMENALHPVMAAMRWIEGVAQWPEYGSFKDEGCARDVLLQQGGG